MNPAVIIEAIPEVLAALQQVRDALMGVVNAILPFVQAIAPSVVMEFNQAIRDLQATIGSAFIGIIQVAASVVREISGALLPTLQQLTPIFTSAANAVGQLFVGAVRLLIVPLQALTPILDVVVGFLTQYAKFLDDVVMVTTALAKVFTSFLQSLFGTDAAGIKDTFKAFFDVLRQAVKAILTFAATLAVAIGQAAVVQQFVVALATEAKERDEKAAGLKAAGTNPQMIDVAAIARQSQLAAFTAAGGGAGVEKTDTDYLRELAESLDEIATKNDTIEAALERWWEKDVMGGIVGSVVKLINDSWIVIKSAFDRLSRLRL